MECLLGYEGSVFASTGDPATDILSITAVHPMREDAVERLLERARADASVLRRLVEEGRLVETRYRDHTYFVRAVRRVAAP